MSKKKGKSTIPKIKKETICTIGLVVLMLGSAAAMLFWRGGGPVEEDNVQGFSVRVVVNFGDSRISEIANLSESMIAQGLFEQYVSLNVSQFETGNVVNSVTYENGTVSNSEANQWVFYVNGGFSYQDINEYSVRNGDIIELRYEEIG